MHHSRWLWLVAALPACAAPGHGDPEVGAAPQGFVSDFFVVGDVVVDPATYHWAAPGLLLASSEGAGPRTEQIPPRDRILIEEDHPQDDRDGNGYGDDA